MRRFADYLKVACDLLIAARLLIDKNDVFSQGRREAELERQAVSAGVACLKVGEENVTRSNSSQVPRRVGRWV